MPAHVTLVVQTADLFTDVRIDTVTRQRTVLTEETSIARGSLCIHVNNRQPLISDHIPSCRRC